MGNCLGLCDLFGSQDRIGLPRLSRMNIQPSAEIIGRSIARRRHNQNYRKRPGRKLSQVLVGPISVLDEATDDVKVHYDLGHELGRGQFGVIRLCTQKHTGENFACKSIAKGRLCRQKDVDDIRREIKIMRQLVGHPNIVELKDVYEDQTWVHLVMELCQGGELFDSIRHKKVYSEKEAAVICKTLMEALVYCHNHGVVHRDLKPENVLLTKESDPSAVKLADFGLAVNLQPGEKLRGIAGSAYYIAPEVLKGEYSEEVDVWSAGVVLYILLSGAPPFWGDTEEDIFEAIKFGRLDLSSDHPWPIISSAAKDLIKGMLRHDVKKRLTPEQVLNHRWVKELTDCTDSSNLPGGLPVDISMISSSWRTETTSFASFYTESAEVVDLESYVASPIASDHHIRREDITNSDVQISSRSSGKDVISVSLPESRYPDDIDVAARELAKSAPDVNADNSFELDLCMRPSLSLIYTQPRLSDFLAPRINLSSGIKYLGLISSNCVDIRSPVLLIPKNNCTCILLHTDGTQRTIVVDTSKEEILMVHDLEQCTRIGWRLLEEKEVSIDNVHVNLIG